MTLDPIQAFSIGDAVIAASSCARLCVVGFHRIMRNDYDGVLLIPSPPGDRRLAVVETAIGFTERSDSFVFTPQGLAWHWPWELVAAVDNGFDSLLAAVLTEDWARHAALPDPRLVAARETPIVERFGAARTPDNELRLRAWRTAMQTRALKTKRAGDRRAHDADRMAGIAMCETVPGPALGAADHGTAPDNVLPFRPRASLGRKSVDD